jgi:hypothetical protein
MDRVHGRVDCERTGDVTSLAPEKRGDRLPKRVSCTYAQGGRRAASTGHPSESPTGPCSQCTRTKSYPARELEIIRRWWTSVAAGPMRLSQRATQTSSCGRCLPRGAGRSSRGPPSTRLVPIEEDIYRTSYGTRENLGLHTINYSQKNTLQHL